MLSVHGGIPLPRYVTSTGHDDEIFKKIYIQKLGKDGALNALIQAINLESYYSVSELGIPGLRHFVYKSRAHVQVTVPEFEDPYDDLQERRRCGYLTWNIHF